MLWVTITTVNWALELVDELLDGEGGDGVQRRGRFIEQQHFRLDGDGTGNHQTLLLTAGETKGVVMQTILHLSHRAAPRRGTLGGLVRAAVVDALQAQAVDHVLVDGLGEGVGRWNTMPT